MTLTGDGNQQPRRSAVDPVGIGGQEGSTRVPESSASLPLPDAQRVVDEMRVEWNALYSTLTPFNERKQESFCRVCRYRDDTMLHDPNCPLRGFDKLFDQLRTLLAQSPIKPSPALQHDWKCKRFVRPITPHYPGDKVYDPTCPCTCGAEEVKP